MRFIIILAALVLFMASSPVFAQENLAYGHVGATIDLIEGNEIIGPNDYLECNGQEIPLDSKYDALREVYGKNVPDYPPTQIQEVVGMENGSYLIATKSMRKFIRAVPFIPPNFPRLSM